MPESYWVTLKDPEQVRGVDSAVVGLAGVDAASVTSGRCSSRSRLARRD